MVKSFVIKISEGEMKKIQSDSIKASLKAIKAEPIVYGALKEAVHLIVEQIVDIDQWEEKAIAVTAYLNTLVNASDGGYFYYSWKNISPEVYGKASTFRAQCRQLKALFKELD